MKTKAKEITVDLTDLFKKQQRLTNYFREQNDIRIVNWDKVKGAIICELWESANELKREGFKEWTKKGRTENTLEELVDVLHFYLQIGNDLGVVQEHHWIEYHPIIIKQYLAITTTMLAIDGVLMWAMSFAQYRGLIEMLGYEWEEDVIPAYNAKYNENIARQSTGNY